MNISFDFFKKENFRVIIFLLGVALLGRSLATINPEFGVKLFEGGAQPQPILEYFNIHVDRYIMTMLWPVAFALLNSFNKETRLSSPFYYTVISFHFASLVVSFAWLMVWVPPGIESLELDEVEQGLGYMRFRALLIFIASIASCVFAYYWYKKSFLIFKPENACNV